MAAHAWALCLLLMPTTTIGLETEVVAAAAAQWPSWTPTEAEHPVIDATMNLSIMKYTGPVAAQLNKNAANKKTSVTQSPRRL